MKNQVIGKHLCRGNIPVMFSLNKKSRVRGSILILVIIILSSLATFGAVLLGMVYSRHLRYQLEMDRTKALYIAEAGISYSVWELKMKVDKENNGFGNVDKFEFGEGFFSVKHNPETKEIISVGDYNNVKRIVTIVYESN
ncbi:MAG: hypothetical protein KAI43_01865 [Candidatus Aureabacteria bacterium]|nr:hypothetical protein [Candidatus Auribacterota bacterium]